VPRPEERRDAVPEGADSGRHRLLEHGGRAPHIKNAARVRIENAADRLARQLLGMAEDPDMPPAVKLAALKDALDRAGLSARQALDVTVEPRWKQMFDRIARGTDGADAPTVVDGQVVGYTEFDDAGDGREP
jgi:hypothetical protein